MSSNKLLDKFEQNRQKVKDTFDRDGVVVAYLFGSGSKGGNSMGPLSDLDFAVISDESLTESERNKLHLAILNDLISLLGDKIDLVVMNDAKLLMKFNVIKHGQVLFQRSKKEKVMLETDIMRKYLDTKYYRERYVDENLKRIERKGFG